MAATKWSQPCSECRLGHTDRPQHNHHQDMLCCVKKKKNIKIEPQKIKKKTLKIKCNNASKMSNDDSNMNVNRFGSRSNELFLAH